jgi:hypothetical protein
MKTRPGEKARLRVVGHYADALRDSTSFLQTVQERRSWRTATSHSSREAVGHIPF